MSAILYLPKQHLWMDHLQGGVREEMQWNDTCCPPLHQYTLFPPEKGLNRND